MESRLKHDLLGRIALGLVESRRRFGFTEHICHSVVANAIARTEIAVSVVIEGAPANPSRILRVGRKLIGNARMAHCVLGEALNLIDRLRGICMSHEFSVQITRMVRRFQGEAKIVHRKYVFEEFGFLKISDASGLPCGIELMSKRVGSSVEIVVITGFINAHAPQYDGGVIPVAANHSIDVVDRNVLPGFVPDMLPSGDLFQHQQAYLVTRIQKVTRLRVMRGPDNVALELVPQDLGIASLNA